MLYRLLSAHCNILSSNIDRFKQLNKQIEELERELQMTKEEYLYDFLTSVLNRRAYEVEGSHRYSCEEHGGAE